MRTSSLLGWILMLCIAGTVFASAAAVPPAQPAEQLVKNISLQSFFHTLDTWHAKIYQVVHPVVGWDGGVSVPAIRVCFVRPPLPKEASTLCAPLRVAGWSYQKLRSVNLRMLPGPDGKGDRPSLVMRATAITGPSGPDVLHGLFVYTYVAGEFQLTFDSEVDLTGEQEFEEAGPLQGAFVVVRQVSEGDEQTQISPRHYRMTVYVPARFGYVKVLSILSKQRYPSDESGDGMQGNEAITALTPEIVNALRAVYPNGVYASAVQR